jgi:N-acetylmuramoyl-L-alanine amidase
MTRREDRGVSNGDRVKMGKLCRCHLAIHIHHNAATRNNPDAPGYRIPCAGVNGTEVLHAVRFEDQGPSWDNISGHSRQCADHVYQHLCQFGGLNPRGIKVRNDVQVLRKAQWAAVLTEASFLTCREQEDRLRDPDYLVGEAQAIADGINDYLRLIATP